LVFYGLIRNHHHLLLEALDFKLDQVLLAFIEFALDRLLFPMELELVLQLMSMFDHYINNFG
jgi:hypothetical protein